MPRLSIVCTELSVVYARVVNCVYGVVSGLCPGCQLCVRSCQWCMPGLSIVCTELSVVYARVVNCVYGVVSGVCPGCQLCMSDLSIVFARLLIEFAGKSFC